MQATQPAAGDESVGGSRSRAGGFEKGRRKVSCRCLYKLLSSGAVGRTDRYDALIYSGAHDHAGIREK